MPLGAQFNLHLWALWLQGCTQIRLLRSLPNRGWVSRPFEGGKQRFTEATVNFQDGKTQNGRISKCWAMIPAEMPAGWQWAHCPDPQNWKQGSAEPPERSVQYSAELQWVPLCHPPAQQSTQQNLLPCASRHWEPTHTSVLEPLSPQKRRAEDGNINRLHSLFEDRLMGKQQ